MGNRSLLRALVLAAAAFAFASDAYSQDRAAHLAAARALIERAQVADLFEPAADDASIAVRHVASGMVCHFSRENTRTELAVFATLPRGQDVGCVRDDQDRATTLYATRYDPPISAEQSLAIAVGHLRSRFTDAQTTPLLAELSSEGLPPLHVAHFLVTIRGERWISSALVMESGGWIYKLRYSARAVEDADIMRHQLEAAAMLTLVALELNPGRPI